MTDISKDDEREAREWLEQWRDEESEVYGKHIATILALLDRPMPEAADIHDDVWDKAVYAARMAGNDPYLRARATYVAVRDALTAPPKPKPVEVWAVVKNNGDFTVWANREQAQHDLREGRIVRLVEQSDDQ